MVHIVSRNITKEQLDAMLRSKPKKQKSINLSKYFGKIKFPEDALAWQKKMRDEWN